MRNGLLLVAVVIAKDSTRSSSLPESVGAYTIGTSILVVVLPIRNKIRLASKNNAITMFYVRGSIQHFVLPINENVVAAERMLSPAVLALSGKRCA